MSPMRCLSGAPSPLKNGNFVSSQASSAGSRSLPHFAIQTSHIRSRLQWCSQKIGSRPAVSNAPINPPPPPMSPWTWPWGVSSSDPRALWFGVASATIPPEKVCDGDDPESAKSPSPRASRASHSSNGSGVGDRSSLTSGSRWSVKSSLPRVGERNGSGKSRADSSSTFV